MIAFKKAKLFFFAIIVVSTFTDVCNSYLLSPYFYASLSFDK